MVLLNISEDAKDLLSKILCPADQRYKISDILRHPWMMFQAPSIMGSPNSRPNTPLRRRSLSHVSPYVSPSASPATSPKDHLKCFVIPKSTFLGKPEMKMKSIDNAVVSPRFHNRRTFSLSTLGEPKSSIASLNIQQQHPQLRSHA